MEIQIDMYQTLAVSVLVLILGQFLKKRINFLEKFCIPAPVIGGLLFAVLTCVCYSLGIAEFTFDDTLREVCMVFFFTSVGFQANLKVLKSGGKSLFIFLGLVVVLIVSQNFLALGVSKLLHLDPLVGLCTGSIPMVGGHGTAGAFGPVLEDFDVKGATTICTAAATFGLIAGSLIGGPIGKRLIDRKKLLDTAVAEDDSILVEDEKKHERHTNMYAAAVFQLIIAVGIGTIISELLTKTGLTFPIYIGAMIAAAVIRNIGEYSGKFDIYMGEINNLGGSNVADGGFQRCLPPCAMKCFGEDDVIRNRPPRQEQIFLQHVAGQTGAQEHGFALQPNVAAIRLHQPGDEVEEGGFSAAAGSQDGEKLPLLQGKRDILNGGDGGFIGGEADI